MVFRIDTPTIFDREYHSSCEQMCLFYILPGSAETINQVGWPQHSPVHCLIVIMGLSTVNFIYPYFMNPNYPRAKCGNMFYYRNKKSQNISSRKVYVFVLI